MNTKVCINFKKSTNLEFIRFGNREVVCFFYCSVGEDSKIEQKPIPGILPGELRQKCPRRTSDTILFCKVIAPPLRVYMALPFEIKSHGQGQSFQAATNHH